MNAYLTAKYIAIAQRNGSTATTLAGAMRWLKARTTPIRFQPRCEWMRFVPRSQRWTDEERIIRRASADKKFRKSILAKTHREIRRLIRPLPPSSSLAEITAAADRLSDTTARLKTLVERIEQITGKDSWVQYECPALPGILMREFSSGFARRKGCRINLCAYDSRIITTKESSKLISQPGETIWKGSRPVRYDRAVRDNYVRSFVVIRTPQTIDVAFHTHEITLTLPDEYMWDHDAYGLKIVAKDSPRDDYHPTVDEMFAKNFISNAIARLVQNREVRLKHTAEIAADLADAEGVLVCVADSLRAGNCLSGTQAFARQHNLDLTKHYPAKELVAIANGDWGRVRLAISAAILRSKQELARGFSNLADHRVVPQQ